MTEKWNDAAMTVRGDWDSRAYRLPGYPAWNGSHGQPDMEEIQEAGVESRCFGFRLGPTGTLYFWNERFDRIGVEDFYLFLDISRAYISHLLSRDIGRALKRCSSSTIHSIGCSCSRMQLGSSEGLLF
jgi:hypothetical protein